MQINFEFISMEQVLHYQKHRALLMENLIVDKLKYYPLQGPMVCITTLASEPRTLVGFCVVTYSGDTLKIAYIEVGKSYRKRGIARGMLTEVIRHPLNILIGHVRYSAGSKDGNSLIPYLEWLETNAKRTCGTKFRCQIDRFLW